MCKRYFISIFAILLLVGGAYQKSHATHAAAVDLSYNCLGNGQYSFNLVFYRSCEPGAASAPSSASIDVQSSCFSQTINLGQGPTLVDTVSQTCNTALSFCNPGGQYPGYEAVYFSDTVSLDTTCSDYTISYDRCCRNGNITNLQNPDNFSTYIETTLDPTLTNCNSSPFFTSTPVPFICEGDPTNYNQGAIDPDGDSLVFNLVDPLDDANQPIQHSAGLSATNPVANNGGFNFDNNTGQMSFTPAGQQQAVVTVEVEEYRNGQLIGTTMRDIQFSVINCNNDQPALVDSVTNLQGGVLVGNNNVEVCPGDTVSFSLQADDPNVGDSLFMSSNVSTAIPGATFDVSGDPLDTLTGDFQWVPSGSDTSTNVFTVTLEDDACPIEARQTYSFNIFVRDGTFASPDTSGYCPAGGPIELSVIGGDQFSWRPDSSIVDANSDSSKIWVAPSVPTNYIVESDLSSTCKNKDTVFVDRVPDFSKTVTPPTDTICRGQSSQLQVSINQSDSLAYEPFTYDWRPSDSLNNGSIANPIASPDETTDYFVDITSDTGCTISDSVSIVVSGQAPVVNIQAPSGLCIGDTTSINAFTCQGQALDDDFDPGIDNSMWSNIGSVVSNGNCGSNSGPNALWFGNTSGTRQIATIDLVTTGGGTLDFYLKEGTSGGNCEAPDASGEYMVLEYSNDGGATWNTINTYVAGNSLYTSFTLIQEPVPAAAQTPSTRFRFRQNDFDSSNDHWAIDDVSYQCCGQGCGTYTYNWTPGTGLSDSTIAEPDFYADTTRTYSVKVTPVGTNCSTTDTVTLNVTPDFGYTVSDNDTICQNQSTQLSIQGASGSGPYSYNWEPGNSLNDSTIADPVATPSSSTTYNVSITSQNGCTNRDSVYVDVAGVAPTVTASANKDTVCPGGSVELDFTPCAGQPFADDFDPGIDNSMWSNVGSVAANGNCGSNSGANALWFGNASGTRQIATIDLVTTGGGTLDFYLKEGTSGGNCEAPDASGEYMVLEYSNDGGATWNTINTYVAGNSLYTSFTLIQEPIPAAAQTSSTRFRFRQFDYDSSNDHWAIDNVSYQCCSQSCGNFAYNWSPASLIDTTINNTAIATVPDDTSFVVAVDEGNGCFGYDTVSVNVINSLSVDAGNDIELCSQDTAQLNATANGTPPPKDLNCGANNSPCPDSLEQTTTVGTGSNVTSQPSPYRGGTKARMQFLYRESNLKSQGLQEGVISALAFDVASKNSTAPYESMNIKIGCTNRDTLGQNSGYVNNLQLVYSQSSYTTSTGWNVHEFDNTFNWDGKSNLIIEVCYENPSGNSGGGGNNDLINTSTVSYDATIFTDDSFAPNTGCNMNVGGLTQIQSTLPNLEFHTCPPPPGEFLVDWTPANGLSDSTILNPTAYPDSSTTYQVSVSDANGCSASDSISVTYDCGFDLNLNVNYETCTNNSTGTAWVAPSGGVSPYSVSWSNGSTQDTITGLTPGDYSVSVTDSTGFVEADSFTLTAPVPVVIDSFDTQDVFCNGDSSGSATVFASGGATGLSYDWSSGDSSQTATNLPNGAYTVIVSDSLGCADTATVNISEPAPINITTGTDSTSCFNGNDGRAYASATAGTSPYTYVWDSTQNGDTATGLSSGTHQVIVTDSLGCIDSATVNVEEPPRISFQTDSTPTSCGGYNDGTATVTPTSGTPPYSYQWSNGDTTQSADSLYAGYHSFTFTDAEGCTVTDSVFVSQPPPVVFDIDSMDISCHGSNDGMAWVNNISGGTSPYAVQWSNGVSGQDTISGLSAGSYTVSVTDDSGCVMMDTVTIDEPDSLVVTFIDSSNVSCNGGSDGWAQFDITGGTTPYVVQSNATANDSVLTNLSAGSHTVKILDDNGCVDSATITLTEPPALISNIDTIIDVKCFGDSTGSVTASSSGGTPPYSYEWDDPANQSGATASSLPAGNYTVTITDDSGCITTDSATIVQPDSFKVDFTVLEPVSCYGASDAMVLASIGGDTTTHSFSWSTGTGAIGTGLDAGTHEVTVTTDSSGCQQTANVTLSQPDSVSLTTTSNPVNCNGGSDGSVSASASGGNGPPFIYVWNTGDSASSVNGLSAGTYEVTAIDTNGCNATSSISISEPAPLDLSTTATPLSCAGGSDGSASVTVSGGTSPYNYAWNDPSGQTSSTADGLTAGTYQVTVTDANNCVDSASVTVTQPEGISFKETDIVDESCPGAKDGAIFLEAEGGTPPYTYILEDDKESSEGAFNGLEGGRDYELTINDGNACNLDTNIRVERPEELVIDFEKDRITTELGQGKRLKPIIRPEDSDGAYNYIWEPNNGLNCVDCREPLATPYNETVYELTVFDENQCRYTETITVSVNNPEILYIPNAFTPNDDDKNDQFRIYGKNINRIDLQIFDRWGEKVFETKDVDEGWDGSFPSGNDAPSGVYVYSVLIEYIDGKTIEKQGSVTLIR